MPFGIAEAVPEPSAMPPSAASPATAYLRLIIKLLLGIFWWAMTTEKWRRPNIARQSNSLDCGFLWQTRAPSAKGCLHRAASIADLCGPRIRHHQRGDVGIDPHQRRHDLVKRVFRDQRVVQH